MSTCQYKPPHTDLPSFLLKLGFAHFVFEVRKFARAILEYPYESTLGGYSHTGLSVNDRANVGLGEPVLRYLSAAHLNIIYPR